MCGQGRVAEGSDLAGGEAGEVAAGDGAGFEGVEDHGGGIAVGDEAADGSLFLCDGESVVALEDRGREVESGGSRPCGKGHGNSKGGESCREAESHAGDCPEAAGVVTRISGRNRGVWRWRVALRVLCCPEAEGFSEDGGERETRDLPEPDAGEEESDAECEEAEEGTEQGGDGDGPCMPVGGAPFCDASHGAEWVEYFAGVEGEAVVRHVAGHGEGCGDPEDCGEGVEGGRLEMEGGHFADERGEVILDHSEEGDDAVLQERPVVGPCGPCGQAVLHPVGHGDAMPHVEDPTDEGNEEPERADGDFSARDGGLEGEAEGSDQAQRA